MNLSDIRFKIEQRVKDAIEDQDVVNWANDAQTELIPFIEIPTTSTIAINTEDISYPEPANIKRINRLWLQSERDNGVDRDIPYEYRRYGGNLIFDRQFTAEDTLNVDYYRLLTYYADISETIDLPDRYEPLYTSYGVAQYYDSPRAVERFGEAQARRQYDKHYARYLIIRDSIQSQYLMETQPSTIKEVL